MHRGGLVPPKSFVRFERTELERSIPDRFERQVTQHPSHTAVKTKGHAWTYAQLNDVANRIARAILERCGEASEPVALLMEQDAPLVAAILGALKANKIYVALDPANPRARIHGMLEDSQAALVVTDRVNHSLAMRLAGASRQVLSLDDLSAPGSADDLRLPIGPDALAYIFYTSGSTGQPKGVVDTHRNVLHNILRYTNSLYISADDRLTLVQSCSFSGSVSSLFCALLNGACSHPFDLHVESPDELAAHLRRDQITIYHSVPAIFRSFLREDRSFPSVRVVRLEGDQAARVDVELFRKHFGPRCMLVNGLGATETGITRQYFMNPESSLPKDRVPIGYPVEDMEILLLDEASRPVPAGTVGQIAVRSEYLSPGYWRGPELTEAAFSPDPQGGHKRIYRTGDLGRMSADGCLEHLGRNDFRVKVLGNTVEVAEVELVLLSHPAIKEAVVVAREDRCGEQRLVAYLVVAGSPAPGVSALRQHVAANCPPYMVPSAFVFLDAMPLSENKKVDRSALPAPSESRPISESPFVGARDELEQRLTKLWEEVLDIRPIGVRDDFFDLGGDSLRGGQLLALIRRSFGTTLPLATLVEAPTIERLADLLRSPGRIPRASLVPIQPGGSRPPLFCVHGHFGEVLFFRALSLRLGPDQPFFGLQSLPPDRAPVPCSVEDMAADYLHEMRAIQPSGPYYLLGYCFGAMVAFEMAQRLRAHGEEVALVALLEPDFPGRRAVLPFRHRISRIRRRIGVQLSEIRSLKTRAHLSTYLSGKARRLREITRDTVHRVRAGTLRLVWPRYSRDGRSLPRFLHHATSINSLAATLYRPRPYPGHLVLFLGADTPTGTGPDPRLGWGELAGGGVDVEGVPGNLVSMVKEPHVGVLATRLREYLGGGGSAGHHH
jgi:amino acid adenylation domain-containing protein